MKKTIIISITLLLVLTSLPTNTVVYKDLSLAASALFSATRVLPNAFETSAELILPYKMSYIEFQLEVLESQGAVIEVGGVKYLNLNLTTELPMGVLYESNKNVVYVAIYPSYSNPDLVWGIAEVNITDRSYKIYRFPWLVMDLGYNPEHPEWGPQKYCGPMPWTITVDGNGELWISIRDYLVTPNHPPTYIPYLAKLNVENNMLRIYCIPKELRGGCDVKFSNGYVWLMTNGALSQINATSEEIVNVWMRDFDGGFMKIDENYIWLASVSYNYVTRFDAINGVFDVNLTGFDRPLGIEVDSKYVYVAENHRREPGGPIINGTIARIDKATYFIDRIVTDTLVTNEGPYHVLKDGDGNLWWTTNSKQIGVRMAFTESMFSYEAISPYCYFMVEVPSNGIWFSCVGSAYVGIVYPLYNSPDINKDGTVDSSDLGILGIAWGSTSGDPNYISDADLNRDSIIDSVDLGMIGTGWGMAK